MATLDVHIDVDGLLNPDVMTRWGVDANKKLKKLVNQAMTEESPDIKNSVVSNAEAKLNIKRKAVLKSFKGKVHFNNKDKMPTMQFYSRIPWMGAFDKGASIGKPQIIPFLDGKRVGYKKFKKLIEDLDAASNLFFEKKSGRTFVWCKNLPAFTVRLNPFKKAMKATTGSAVKKNERVNIGIYKVSTSIKKKINMTDIVASSVPDIANRIETLGRTL